jgi:ABC-2 type transport system ATP-binding protein
MHAIELEHLRKLYGERTGIEDVTFAVPEGAIFGFIGPNGAGKTTTIRILLGLIAPTSGRAQIFGVDAVADGPRARAGVGYVAGETHLYPAMRAGELLAYFGRFHPGDHAGRRRRLAERFELDLGARTADLSLGNRRKVSIVAALQHAPRLAILDEPTSGLDPVIRARLFDQLRDDVAGGATVVFSSHALAEIEAVCDRVAIVNAGRVVAVDEVGALRRRAMRRVHATFDTAESGDALSGLARTLAGVSSFERHGAAIAFLYRGPVPPLLDALAASSPVDVRIEEASLEDVFLADFAPAAAKETFHAA